MANIATITNNIISALSGTSSQILLGDATLTDFKLDSLTDVSVPTPGDGDVLRWNATLSLWEASDAAGITGSGTINYIPKFTSGGVLGNSGLYETGNAIGYGTTTLSTVGGQRTIEIFAPSFPTLRLNGNGSVITTAGSNAQSSWGSIGTETNHPFLIFTNNATKATFDALGNLGLGTSSVSSVTDQKVLEIYANSFPTLRLNALGTVIANILTDDVSNRLSIGTFTNHPIIFATNDTERMRLTNIGRLGINTTGPTQTLHVEGTFRAYQDAFNYIIMDGTNLTMAANAAIVIGDNSTDSVTIGAATGETRPTIIKGGPISFQTTSTTRMTIAQDGSLGIKVTPSAWGTGTTGIDFGSGSALWNPGSQFNTLILNNAYNNGTNYIYKGSGAAAAYGMQVGNQHIWYQAVSGTAGNTITFTQAMTLDATGNLQIGQTTDAYNEGNRVVLGINGTTNSLISMRGGGTSLGYIYATSAAFDINANSRPLTFSTTGTERGRFFNNGNFSIGSATDTGQKLQVTGTAIITSTFNAAGVSTLGSAQTTVLAYIGDTNTVNTRYIKFSRAAALTDIVNIQGVNGGIGADNIALQAEGGNIGIGTTSPQDYVGYTTVTINGRSGANGGALRLKAFDNTSSFNIYAGGAAANFNTTSSIPYIWFMQDTERMRISSAGNVGIGTTNPTSLLTVNGSFLATTSGVGLEYNSGVLYHGPSYYQFPSGGYYQIYGRAGMGLIFGSNNAEVGRFDLSGNLGIGTNLPAYKLHVNGFANATGYVNSGTTFNKSIYIGNITAGTTFALGRLNFADVYTHHFRVRISSYYGVKTFDFFGYQTTMFKTVSGVSNGGDVVVEAVLDGSNQYTGVKIGITTVPTDYVYTATIECLSRFSSWEDYASNTVLTPTTIGFTNTFMNLGGGNLSINSNVYNVKFSVNSGISSSTANVISIQQNTNGAVKDAAALGIAVHNNGEATNAASLLFTTAINGSLTEKMRLTHDGLLGIGTTAPTEKLVVQGNGAKMRIETASAPTVYYTQMESNYDAANTFNIIDGGGYKFGSKALVTYNDTYINSFYNVYIATGTVTNNSVNNIRLYVTQTGNVGIGTTTPSAQLTLNNATEARFRMNVNGVNQIIFNHDGSTGIIRTESSTPLTFGSFGSERMRITEAGNVGIGNTNPLQKLDVNGDALINGIRVGKGPNSLSGNTVLGASALNGVTTGNNNVAIGPNALDGTTTGNYNIAIGFFAGGIGASENTTGSQNIFIGTETQGESSTESNRTWIGGNTTTSTWLGGNLLLGTKTNSTYRLDVVGAGRISNGLLVSGGTVSIQTLSGAGTAIVVTDNAGNLSTQPTTTYLSSLSGEATNSGSVVTLTNSSVIGKVLTGLNVNSAAITASDSILSAFGKIQGQIDGLQGGTIYKGSWNASTNTPTITSSVGTQGNYYVVTTAGTTNINGVSSWAVGDWIIFNGSVWEKIPNVDAITSVNGQTGVVSLTTSNISEGTNLYYTDARARAAISLTTSGASGAATYSSGVLNIPTYTLTGLGGVASTRTLTINGTALDLSADRSWSVGTVTSVNATVPTGFTIGSAVTSSGNIAIGFAAGYSLPTTASQSNWDAAYNDRIVSAAVSGTTTKTLTLTQQDSGTITASWTDINTDAVTSVFGRTGAVIAVSGDYTTAQVTESGNLYYTDARARAAISLTTTGTSGAATYSSGVLNIPNYSLTINYDNNANANYQMLWGSGNAIYGTAGITCNPFTDSVNLTGTLFSGGLTVNGFGRMYGGDFWHSGTANNGTRTPTLKLGRFSDSETPAYVVYTDDTNGDILEFYSDRYTGDFRLTRNSESGLRNMMRVNSDNGGSVIDLYSGDGSTLGAKIQSNGDARFAYDVVAYYSFSDARLKTNVLTIENPLQKVMAMRGVSYEWLEGHKKGKKEIGLIAQEVMEIIPEVVSEKERIDGSKFLSVDYEHLTGLLIEAVKELKKEIDELKSK